MLSIKHVRHGFLVSFKGKVSARQEMSAVTNSLDYCLPSFSTAACFSSHPWRVLEKKATGHPFWLRVAAIATSEASVSTSKGTFSSIAVTTAFSIKILRLSKASTASCDNGNNLQPERGFTLSENAGIHLDIIGKQSQASIHRLHIVWNRQLV